MTPDQYALGVALGHLLASAMKNGMTYAEATETIAHADRLLRFSEATGRSFADYTAPICPCCARPMGDPVPGYENDP